MADNRAEIDVAQLVAEYHQAVYRYAFRLTGSVPDAEDLTQQVFLQAHRKLGQLRNVERAQSWLFAILRNAFFKSCQKQRDIAAEDLRLDVDLIPGEVEPEAPIDREELQRALDQLSPEHRMVLVMFFFEECSYREIAEQLDVPMGTVMSRLARAKRQLRAKLIEPMDRTEAGCLGNRDQAAQRG